MFNTYPYSISRLIWNRTKKLFIYILHLFNSEHSYPNLLRFKALTMKIQTCVGQGHIARVEGGLDMWTKTPFHQLTRTKFECPWCNVGLSVSSCFKLYHTKLYFQRLFNSTLGKAECTNICNVTTVHSTMWGYLLVLSSSYITQNCISEDCPKIHWKSRMHRHM
jgi:hypothetical protein